jgi:chromosome segregation ATPase
MYIEELIIDGFKRCQILNVLSLIFSYATRTVIRDWDEKFNAITGLNGSGKSNIFDAIIFVLGAVNWSQLRAQSINNLVYKVCFLIFLSCCISCLRFFTPGRPNRRQESQRHDCVQQRR